MGTIRLTELCQTYSLATHAHHFMLAEVQHLEINAAHSNSKMENTTVIIKRVIASFELIKSSISIIVDVRMFVRSFVRMSVRHTFYKSFVTFLTSLPFN